MTELRVTVTSELISSIRTATSSSGYVLGVIIPDSGSVLLDVFQPSEGGLTKEDLSDLLVLLPYNWSILGCYIKNAASEEDTAAQAKQLLTAAGEQLVKQAAAVVISLASDGKPKYFQHDAAGLTAAEDVKGTDYSSVQSKLATFRCHCSLNLEVLTSEACDLAKSLQVAHHAAATKLDANNLAFMIERPAQNPVVITTSSSGTVDSLLPAGNTDSSLIISAQPLLDCTTSYGEPADFAYDYQPVGVFDCRLRQVRVELDVLCVAARSAEVGELVDGSLQPSLQRQLSAVVEQLGGLSSLEQVRKVATHHCRPAGRWHPVTMMYTHESTDVEAVESAHLKLRQRLHARLGLPAAKPCLRLAHALPLNAKSAGAETTRGVQRLRNVHEGLTPPIAGGQVYLVDGDYDYHHYMQDKFNDAGWGCAYRSLQTICSWFRAQQYTSKEVPSHREIQEILVKLGDKDASFVGSSNWIGAIELSYILDEYLGVTSKIVTVNRGEDIPTRARELAQHFVNQGTPVMIGGGVLAYTLLGVQLHEQTGDCAFLILDPHYTGGEDLKKIHQGTWVAWKKFGDTAAAGGPLFVPDAFYNFMCPQRPKLV